MSKNLADFLADYNSDGSHPVTEITIPADSSQSAPPSPFIIVRCGDKVAIINPMGFHDHLCVDVHSFVAGEDATAGVFGMSAGKRWALPETGTTSHGWNSANLIAVLVGEQGEK
jgi:hypothetical protein